jgi:hypothetical protein
LKKLKHIKLFEQFKLNEIATTEIKPNIIDYDFTTNSSVYYVKIKDDTYLINIMLYGNNNDATLQVDFMIKKDDGEYSNKLTNNGDMLLIMANIIGVIKVWAETDDEVSFSNEIVNFKDININAICVASKSEKDGDNRRSNIYNYYLLKNFEKLGIKIIEKRDITTNYKNTFKIPISANMVVDLYKISPITIEKLR